MMTTLRALVIAFSMYSQIPMPQFTWQDKEMKYAFCFFPWVGAAIGGITMFWWWFCGKFSDRKSTRLNSSHMPKSRMPSSA